MRYIPQLIPDVIIIEPKVHIDNRGYFMETFRQDLFEETVGYKVNFIQDNESKSKKGVLRGMHYQLPPYTQAKLVRVIEGKILDVALDIRRSSRTFGKHIATELSADNKRQMFLPHGFAHGFIVLSESATFSYKVDNYYAPMFDRGIAYNDSKLAIDWKLSPELFHLSEKDKLNPNLIDAKEIFK